MKRQIMIFFFRIYASEKYDFDSLKRNEFYQYDNCIFRKIDTDKFSGVLKLDSGDKITLPYEQFSKKYQP